MTLGLQRTNIIWRWSRSFHKQGPANARVDRVACRDRVAGIDKIRGRDLLNSRLGEPQTAAGYAADLERLPTDPNAPTIGSDLASSVRAHAAAEQGQDVQAWEALERVRGQFGMYQVFHPLVSGPLDRLLRAQILRRGQDREALN